MLLWSRCTTREVCHDLLQRCKRAALVWNVDGEWNPGWRGIYTLDANVNLQVAAMNTGHLTQAQLGYITFS